MWLLGVAALFALGLGARVHLVGKQRPRFPPRPLTAVVLGAKVAPDGTPSPALVERVRVAVSLLQEGHAQRLLLSGRSPEAQTMARLAIGFGAQEAQLVLESESRSTFENAARAAESLQGEREILLVTCDFHLARATAHFRRRGFWVWPVASLRSLTAGKRLQVTGKELAALLRRPWLIARL